VKKQIIQLEENKKHVYALVIGQCSSNLDSKLQGSATFAQAKADQDVVQLLLVIQGYCCPFNDHQQSTALKQGKHQVSTYYQAHDVTNTEFVEHFKALIGLVETYGGAYGCKPGLVATQLVTQGVSPQDVDTADQEEVVKAEAICCECYLSCMLLCGTDNGWYFELKVNLLNNMTMGTNNFPKTIPKIIVETMRLLTNYVAPPRLQRVRNPDGKGLAFVQGKGGARHGPRGTVPTRARSIAGTAAERITRMNAPS
jgi:hypothetical protein